MGMYIWKYVQKRQPGLGTLWGGNCTVLHCLGWPIVVRGLDSQMNRRQDITMYNWQKERGIPLAVGVQEHGDEVQHTQVTATKIVRTQASTNNNSCASC